MGMVHGLPDLDQLNEEALRALIVSRHQQIEHLKLLIAQMRRMQFGRKSEKLTRQIEQLELQRKILRRGTPRRRFLPLVNLLRRAKPPLGVRCLAICLELHTLMHRKKMLVRDAAGSCASWAKMFRRCWSMCRHIFM